MDTIIHPDTIKLLKEVLLLKTRNKVNTYFEERPKTNQLNFALLNNCRCYIFFQALTVFVNAIFVMLEAINAQKLNITEILQELLISCSLIMDMIILVASICLRQSRCGVIRPSL